MYGSNKNSVGGLNMDYKMIGKNIRARRKELGLTQEKVAEMADVSTSFYSYIENGTRKAGITTFVKLSEELGISLDYIIYGIKDENEELDEYETKILFRLKNMDSSKKLFVLKMLDLINLSQE